MGKLFQLRCCDSGEQLGSTNCMHVCSVTPRLKLNSNLRVLYLLSSCSMQQTLFSSLNPCSSSQHCCIIPLSERNRLCWLLTRCQQPSNVAERGSKRTMERGLTTRFLNFVLVCFLSDSPGRLTRADLQTSLRLDELLTSPRGGASEHSMTDGTVLVVECSATTRKGIQAVLDAVVRALQQPKLP
jgi:hypothetical protein